MFQDYLKVSSEDYLMFSKNGNSLINLRNIFITRVFSSALLAEYTKNRKTLLSE